MILERHGKGAHLPVSWSCLYEWRQTAGNGIVFGWLRIQWLELQLNSGNHVSKSQSSFDCGLQFMYSGEAGQGFGPLGLRCCFCCASSFGVVWPRWSGSCTFFVASLVLPSLLTATCVLLSSAMPTTLSRSG